MFRIRIWLDPYHLAGSGSRSTSGNVDLDPSSINKSWLTNTKIHQNYKNIIFLLRNHLFCWIYVNNQVINYKKKKTSLWVLYIYRKKSRKQNWSLWSPTRSGSVMSEADPRIRIRIKMKWIRNTEKLASYSR